MRRTLAAAALALPLIALSGEAQAAPGGGATITRGEEGGLGCLQSVLGESFTTDYLEIATPGGVTTVRCRFDNVEDFSTTKAERATGFPCITALGRSVYSSFVVTPSGKGTLICRVRT